MIRLSRARRQRGQALLIVLAFVAAFLLILWAGLALASAAFLGVNSVRADTRNTYALDAGLAYGMELIDDKNGNGCNAPKTGQLLTLPYPTGAITVTTTINKGNPCHGNGATWNITVTLPPSISSRTLTALITEVNGASVVTWEAYQ
ncbi:MAG TPA: hypothetical protein VHW91_02425 [Candidatus Dormibacteraeota bacterium]|nr:hypothetical protein [Candidatus Dormibacteraeota bacterium]